MKEPAYNRYSLIIKRPHLILLGAGASLAAFPNGEKNGMELPLMNNFVETVNGLSDYLNEYGIDYRGKNFEDLYSSLYDDSLYDEIRKAVEDFIEIMKSKEAKKAALKAAKSV